MKDLFNKKSKGQGDDKSAKKGSLFGKKPAKTAKPTDEIDLEANVESSAEAEGFSLKGNKKSAKPSRAKGKKSGNLDFSNIDIAKMDTKKIIMGLVAVLVVLVLALVGVMMMGGDKEQPTPAPVLDSSEPVSDTVPILEPAIQPEPQPTVQEPMPATAESVPNVAEQAPPVQVPVESVEVAPPVVAPPPAPEPAPAPAPVTPPPQPVAAAPAVPAQQPTPPQKRVKQPPQQPAQNAAGDNGGGMSYDDFLKETKNKVYRERNTAPPTSTQ